MDNREAKFILSTYRPDGQDANDPSFAAALEQARRDPMLERWFRDAVSFDAAVTEKLRAIGTPADLRENILAGVKVSRASRWTNRFDKWAIAAALILTATLGSLIWHKTRPAQLAGWQKQALDVVSSLVRNESSFDAQSSQPRELVDWLRANRAPAAQELPDNLDQLSSLGCKTFSWNGIPVSVICFARPDGGLIHFVMMKSPVAPNRIREAKAKFIQRGEWATATWRKDDMICMLALEGSRDQLRSYLL